ncbi:Serine/threonine-protein kinase [Zea mays]|uniref:non-specific serine/threonine protein kinase n=1 Tax=Zea mays TaxID=4577 RepID=A0A1D6JF78_MAIZE|nr:Serine/threonine-protein kinase [Zea mays]
MAVLNLLALIIATLLLLFRRTSGAGISPADTLNSGGNVTDGETLVSAGGTFTLGFFSPSTTVLTKRYLGIWFTASGTDAVLWVANRETPLNNTSGVLVMSSRVGLRLLDGSGRTAWSSNTTGASTSSVAQLLGSGNLVVREKSSNAVFQWQSFDHPQNTLLAGMRFGKNLKTGMEWSLTSWRAQDDPATGDYRRVMDTKGLPDIVTWHGNAKKYRAGPWNGRWFSGVPEMDSGYKLFSVQMVDGPDEVTYVLNTTAGIPFTRVVLDEVGKVRVLMWLPTSRVWKEYPWLPRDACDEYTSCGAFGLCNVDAAPTPSCSCAVGFSPVNASEWSRREASGGCQRDVPLECAAGNGTAVTDRFAPVHGVKLPDTDNATVDMGATLEQCKARCLANCSCVAYAPADIRGGGDGSGCVMWKDNIVDVRYIENGQDLFLRLAKSESATGERVRLAKILVPVMAFVLALTAAGMYLAWNCKLRAKRRNRDNLRKAILGYSTAPNELGDENVELPFVSLGEIAAATNNFSEDNMLGQGGFGKVYKGTLGQNVQVAIKRLGQCSGQGVEEFRNEAVLIAKLQHRNLVRLLGCCIDGDEKLLVYEYLPNRSLDSIIFGMELVDRRQSHGSRGLVPGEEQFLQ